MPLDLPSLAWLYMHTYAPDTYVTPLAKILATGLHYTPWCESWQLHPNTSKKKLFILCINPKLEPLPIQTWPLRIIR